MKQHGRYWTVLTIPSHPSWDLMRSGCIQHSVKISLKIQPSVVFNCKQVIISNVETIPFVWAPDIVQCDENKAPFFCQAVNVPFVKLDQASPELSQRPVNRSSASIASWALEI